MINSRVFRVSEINPKFTFILALIAGLISILSPSCSRTEQSEKMYVRNESLIVKPASEIKSLADSSLYLDELTELKRGDILVKANHNWWPGTSFVEGGELLGHAAIVLYDVTGRNTVDLLEKAIVFEAYGGKVPEEFQIRKIHGLAAGPDQRFSNTSFVPRHKGIRFRLRMPMSKPQQDSILAFILRQNDGVYSYRALKSWQQDGHQEPRKGIMDKKSWYCTLLIWQAWFDALAIDIDANSGLTVFPNDLINSPYFNNHQSEKENRVRF